MITASRDIVGRSSYAVREENTAARMEYVVDRDFTAIDYAAAKKKTPIHNRP